MSDNSSSSNSSSSNSSSSNSSSSNSSSSNSSSSNSSSSNSSSSNSSSSNSSSSKSSSSNSSSSNSSSSNCSSSNSSISDLNTCFTAGDTIFIFSAMTFSNLLLLFVFILVCYLGNQQWRRRRSESPAATSHSNLFTYHAAAMQLSEVLGLSLYFCGGYNNLAGVNETGTACLFVSSFGLALFHILTCVEHFLAVAHPITYLHLKQRAEVWIRTACAVCVWLLSFGGLVLFIVGSNAVSSVSYLCGTLISLIIISFCSLSVLRALRRSGPGEVGGAGKQVDQSKRRAFHTIVTIMGVLLFRFVGNLILLSMLQGAGSSHTCVVELFTFWLDLPSSLVLPVLFLHRAGKLKCCQQKTEHIRQLDL